MSTFAILLLCAQACFIQNVYGACWRGPAGLAPAPALLPRGPAYGACGLAAPGMGPRPVAAGAYGGSGIGALGVVGELPVAGVTDLSGQVPILGEVQFAGAVPAAGSVAITGSCGWNRAYL